MDLHDIPQQHMLIPPCWFEKRASKTEEQHAYITRNFIGKEKVTVVMHIGLKTSDRHKFDPRVMKERIDENHPWVTEDGRYTVDLTQ